MTPEPVVREQNPGDSPNMSGAGRWQPGSEAPPGLADLEVPAEDPSPVRGASHV